MRQLMMIAAAAVFMTAPMTAGNARAAAMPNAAAATPASEAVPLQKAQYFWSGRN